MHAIAAWLEIDARVARRIFAYHSDTEHLYGKPRERITPQDVINKLEKYRLTDKLQYGK